MRMDVARAMMKALVEFSAERRMEVSMDWNVLGSTYFNMRRKREPKRIVRGKIQSEVRILSARER